MRGCRGSDPGLVMSGSRREGKWEWADGLFTGFKVVNKGGRKAKRKEKRGKGIKRQQVGRGNRCTPHLTHMHAPGPVFGHV